MRKMIRAGTVAVLIGLSIPIGLGYANRTTQTRTMIRREARATNVAATTSGLSCAGGEDYTLQIEIVPDAVVATNGREEFEYHAEFTNALKTEGAIAWSATLVNDLGEVVSVLDASAERVASGQTALSKALRTGALDDGAYLLRVTAALSDGTNDVSFESSQPFVVSKGKIAELTSDEWWTTTRANRTIVLKDKPALNLQFPKRERVPNDQQVPTLRHANQPGTGSKSK